MALAKYKQHKINETTYAIEEKTLFSQGLCYLVIGSERALLIDTGFGFKGLLEAVRALTELPLITVNTHAHIDHIRGNHFFDEIWYHEADKDVFELHTNEAYTSGLVMKTLPFPMNHIVKRLLKKVFIIDTSGQYKYFGDSHMFNLGGRDIEVVPTPGHTPGSVCFIDRANRMLFTGDSLCEWGILLNMTIECCKPEVYLESMRRIKAISNDFNTIWPGHHGFPVDKSYIDEYVNCAKGILDGTVEKVRDKGRLAAKYGRVLITIPEE